MLRSIYTATSGLLTTSRSINVRSNNLANLSTAGFKEDKLVSSTFADKLALSQSVRTVGDLNNIGSVTRGLTALEVKTNFDQGGLQETYRSVDLAIMGEGFFTIEHPDEENVYYTRNGQFQIDPDGFLINGLGHFVLDDYGDSIQVSTAEFIVDNAGMIYDTEGTEIARLGLIAFENPEVLMKSGEETFMATGMEEYEPEEIPFAGVVQQGYIEMANTNVMEQMSGLITSSRAYQSMTTVIKTIDGVLAKSISEVARVF